MVKMNYKSPIIIKIGGSVLTDKKRTDKIIIRETEVDYIASEVAALLDAGYRIILVHGVGIVGHLPVRKYKLYLGIKEKQQLIYLTYTQNQVNRLRQMMLEKLEKHGVPAVKFYPSSMAVQNNGRITEFFLKGLKRFYDTGFTPVISGDMVADMNDDLKLSVCSGDQLAFHLAQAFNSRLIIFGVDVDGVLDREGNVVQKLTLEDLEKIIAGVGTGSPVDVTGGMKGKLSEALEHRDYFEKGGEVWIINMLKKGNLYRAVTDGSGEFTRITR